ncbi:Dimer_Tnp_hAT domain-containing protein/DUF4371 domain-containing protein, partial [Cephalotus follicularis]
EVDLDNLPIDHGLGPKILEYHPNDRDAVRRTYLLKIRPCQPRKHNFPQRNISNVSRRFNPAWFNEYGNWLEYSISKDAAFCFCCYLFKHDIGKQGDDDSFVLDGFRSWHKKERFNSHVGAPNSAHNKSWKKCEDFMNQNQHIQDALVKQSNQARSEYRARLTNSIDCIRFLLHQGLAFRGHDESDTSHNQGNFFELLQFLADHNESINKVVLQNAPNNIKLISHDIQNDIISVAANETVNAIIKDLGGELFAIVVDESLDVSNKEQMAIVLRYVNKNGCVIERFLSILHVLDTTALSLKVAIESLFSKHGLSMSRIHGQGYDGASNMRGEFNGLKSLITKENKCAFYIHCFAHQLQLTLVAKNVEYIDSLFNLVVNLLNVVGASCKRHELLRQSQAARVTEALRNGELTSGRGLNQETSLKRACDTRWGSHYGTLLNLITIFSSIIYVLENIADDGSNTEQRGEARVLLQLAQSFDFIFNLQLMRNVLGITNELSQVLQRKDHDIVNVMALVPISKQRLQKIVYPLVYLLVKLTLILPVATASMERVFSAMKYVKNRLCNRMRDSLMNNCLVMYIEKYVFSSVDNETVIHHFQK